VSEWVNEWVSEQEILWIPFIIIPPLWLSWYHDIMVTLAKFFKKKKKKKKMMMMIHPTHPQRKNPTEGNTSPERIYIYTAAIIYLLIIHINNFSFLYIYKIYLINKKRKKIKNKNKIIIIMIIIYSIWT